ncbi:hypothetical protein FH972_022927 [Carpinus fangiana]|uniref:Xylose isomerase-like TIM barrel domain-containing protein n=1 Tax=Carpinus fangiana TaxID=176857 RepID=A0A5N6KTZ9_9ROSI|nr:hypothetical protein FH972_022927 [Carpinus fangiana]
MARPRTHQQPQYDFLTGGGEANNESMPFRDTLRGGASAAVRADAGNEDLRAQIHKLQYELDSFRQERELAELRHQEEIRTVQAKAEEDYKRAQASESSTHAASSRYEQLAQQLRSAQETASEEKGSLERKFKAAQDRSSTLQEELDEEKAERAEHDRQFRRDLSDLQAKCDALARSDEEARVEHERQAKALELAQQRLTQREEEVGTLENEIMRLKTQTGDADTLAVIKRELSEQVSHIQKLEATNNEQRAELKNFRKTSKGIQVVEEEKKHLESKLARMNDLRKELTETQLQKQILEDERREWAAYLEDAAEGDTEMRFDSPQDLAKAFVQERMERATLTDKLGQVKPELNAKDSQIEALEADKAALTSELERARGSFGTGEAADGNAEGNDGAVSRLERQRGLLQKEIDLLRAQLKTFDTEASELNPETFDGTKSARITELEGLLDQHGKEATKLHDALKALEANASSSAAGTTPSSPLKRARDSSDSPANTERIAQKQLNALKSSSRVRVLEFKDNPTAIQARIKQSTLDVLRSENEALLAKLGSRPSGDDQNFVSRSTVERLKLDLEDKEREIATAKKHDLRLKTIFQGKAMEFNDSVASILGWKLEFMPNGRVKAVPAPTSSKDAVSPPALKRGLANETNGAAATPSKRARTERGAKVVKSFKEESDSEEDIKTTPAKRTPKKSSTKASAPTPTKAITPPPSKRTPKKATEGNKSPTASKDNKPARAPRKTADQKAAEAMPLAARTIPSALSIGAHVSGAGGVHNVVNNALHIGANSLACFLKSQRKWANPDLKEEHADAFVHACKEHSYNPGKDIVPHGSYLVNLAAQEKDKADQAYASFLDDLKRCDRLGIGLATMAAFDRIVGAPYLRAVHLNDSKGVLASHRDLHQNIGVGFLGLRAFHNLVNDPRFVGVPMVLETPTDRPDPKFPGDPKKTVEDRGVWAREIKLLESLRGMSVESAEFAALEAELQARGAAERKKLQEQFDKAGAKGRKKKAAPGARLTAWPRRAGSGARFAARRCGLGGGIVRVGVHRERQRGKGREEGEGTHGAGWVRRGPRSLLPGHDSAGGLLRLGPPRGSLGSVLPHKGYSGIRDVRGAKPDYEVASCVIQHSPSSIEKSLGHTDTMPARCMIGKSEKDEIMDAEEPVLKCMPRIHERGKHGVTNPCPNNSLC